MTISGYSTTPTLAPQSSTGVTINSATPSGPTCSDVYVFASYSGSATASTANATLTYTLTSGTASVTGSSTSLSFPLDNGCTV